MSKFLSLESPIIQFLERVADIFIISCLTVLISLPIFTIGPAITAAFKVQQNTIMKNEQPVLKTYFRAFTSNFKQAALIGLIGLVVLAFLVFDLLLVYFNMAGNLAFLLYLLLGLTTVIAMGTAIFSLQLVARYDNTFKEHLRNGFFLAMANLPSTVFIMVLVAIPIAIIFINPNFFFDTVIFWAFCGIGLLLLCITRIICPILQKLEEVEEGQEEIE